MGVRARGAREGERQREVGTVGGGTACTGSRGRGHMGQAGGKGEVEVGDREGRGTWQRTHEWSKANGWG